MKAGWQRKKLGELLEIQNGYAFDSKRFSPIGDMPLIRIRDLNVGTDTETRYIGEYDKKYLVKAGDLLIGMDGEFGCYKWNGSPALLNQRVCRLQNFHADLNQQFLFYGINSHLKDIEEITGYTTVKHISSKQILGIDFLLPSPLEQERIVTILDEAFKGVATAIANAEKNLSNARELFESYLQSIFTNRGDGWGEKTLGQLSKKKDAIVSGPFGSNLKVSDYKDKGIPILRLQNVGKGHFIDKSIKYINEEKAEELKYHSYVSGDIVLAKLGIPIGKTCIIPPYFKDGLITADVVRIRPDLDVANYKFLEYFLNTNLAVAQLTNNISGATRPRVNLSDVRNIVINLPSLKTQEIIVQKLETLSTETKKLEAIYQQKLMALEELKKSILHQAFSGQLH